MRNKRALVVMSVICATAIMVMAMVLITTTKQEAVKFVPPEFDKTAQTGVPDVPKNLGWSKLYREGMTYTAWICGNLYVKDSSCEVYFANDKSNDKWMKLRMMNEKGRILGETGIIRPGEYVRSIKLDKPLASGTKIKLKIMGYEKDTYYSAGSVVLNTVIK